MPKENPLKGVRKIDDYRNLLKLSSTVTCSLAIPMVTGIFSFLADYNFDYIFIFASGDAGTLVCKARPAITFARQLHAVFFKLVYLPYLLDDGSRKKEAGQPVAIPVVQLLLR